MFFILLRCLTPEQNTITKIIICYPIKEIEKKIGYYTPLIINIILCSFLFVFILYIPAMFVNKVDLLIIIGFIVCLLLQSLTVTLILFSTFNILMYAFAKIKIPYYKNLVTIIIIFGVVGYYAHFFKIYNDILTNYKTYKFSIITIAAPLITLFSSSIPKIEYNYFVIIVTIILSIVIFFIVSNLSENLEDARPLKIFGFLKFYKNPITNLSIKEIKILMRNEEIFMFNILACIIALLIRNILKLNISNKSVCLILGALSSFMSIYSYGMEEEYIPLYKSLGINYKQFTYGKLIGNFITAIIIYIILSLILFTYPINIYGTLYGFITIFLGVLILYLIGVLFPTSQEKPFMQGLVSIGIIIGMIPTMFIINKLSSINKYFLYILVLSLLILIYYYIFKVSKLKWNKEE
ncbi:MAG: hypothetical protein ACERKZ_20160 [Lachnotalea sp.]